MTSPCFSVRTILAGLVLVVLARSVLAEKPAAKEAPAKLVVKLRADANLTIDGDPTRQTGPVREFISPPLKPGMKYQYKLEAKWEPNNYTKITRQRVAVVKAGETTEVDMRQNDPKQADDIIIRYVPTPPEVVDAMCKLAGVTKDDVVFDLGCGDGRIVIAAVQKFNAKKGIGVDIDPERIAESKENAKQTTVQDRLEFRQGDVFKVQDLDKGSVIMLYMSNELNQQLRPTLQQKLKPGSRIVSHRFTMGDWKPDKTERLEVDGEEFLIHLWTIKEKKDK